MPTKPTLRTVGKLFAGLFSGGAVAAVPPNAAGPPIPIEPGDLGVIADFGVSFFNCVMRKASPYCPGIRNALVGELRGFRDRLIALYPNLREPLERLIPELAKSVQAFSPEGVAATKASLERWYEEERSAKAAALIVEGPPPEWLITDAREHCWNHDAMELIHQLEASRLMWRQYRELVESEGYPEDLAAVLRDENDCEPGEFIGLNDKVLRLGYQQYLDGHSREVAEQWMKNGVANRMIAERSAT